MTTMNRVFDVITWLKSWGDNGVVSSVCHAASFVLWLPSNLASDHEAKLKPCLVLFFDPRDFD